VLGAAPAAAPAFGRGAGARKRVASRPRGAHLWRPEDQWRPRTPLAARRRRSRGGPTAPPPLTRSRLPRGTAERRTPLLCRGGWSVRRHAGRRGRGLEHHCAGPMCDEPGGEGHDPRDGQAVDVRHESLGQGGAGQPGAPADEAATDRVGRTRVPWHLPGFDHHTAHARTVSARRSPIAIRTQSTPSSCGAPTRLRPAPPRGRMVQCTWCSP